MATDKGIDRLGAYVAAVRENIGYDMPLWVTRAISRGEVGRQAGQGLREVQPGTD